MSTLVADCPRCDANSITLDILAEKDVGEEHGWQTWYEIFCICRNCNRSIIFLVSEKGTDVHQALVNAGGILTQKSSINNYMNIDRHISVRDNNPVSPPEHLPEDIEKCFNEGAVCLATECWNAAGTMFRICLDLTTRPMLSEFKEDEKIEGLNSKVRRDLGLRLPWLFDNEIIPESLRELSACVREDGNDGAHAGTLGKEDAEDLLDFTVAFLERIFTEPRRLEIAKERREARRANK